LRRPLERGLYAAIESHKHVFQAVTLDPSSGELAEARLPATREALRSGPALPSPRAHGLARRRRGVTPAR